MGLMFKLKHHFFNAFRELFIHNHNSLEFRAKIFALVIAANENTKEQSYDLIKAIAMDIYKNDEDRSNLLIHATKELVKKVQDNNGLDIDILVENIQRELRDVPRYAKKIDIDILKKLLEFTHDRDILSYQVNIIEFLQNLKDETLHLRKEHIIQDEENLESRY